jgi:uncharacterized protein (DUF58 family)
VTPRGVALLLGGTSLAVIGWLLGWPELTALGSAAAALVITVVACVAHGTAVQLAVESRALRVVRGEQVAVKVSVASSRRRRALRLVEGAPALPARTVSVPSGRGQAVVDVPVSTGRRGLYPLGPFTLVRGDPWSIWRVAVSTAPGGSVLVRPRTFPVRHGLATAMRQGDSEVVTRRHGEDHFFALRDYVLGDEPRSVHWRSSARTGRLVVRQKVAAASEGTLLVLDTDTTAYASQEAFSHSFVDERFEAAVEVIASLCVAKAAEGQLVHLATTSVSQPSLQRGASVQGLLDALATVSAVIPVDTRPADIPAIARRSRCSQLIIVTGSPSADLVAALRRCGSMAPVLVRVAGAPAAPVAGAVTLDVPDAAGLS